MSTITRDPVPGRSRPASGEPALDLEAQRRILPLAAGVGTVFAVTSVAGLLWGEGLYGTKAPRYSSHGAATSPTSWSVAVVGGLLLWRGHLSGYLTAPGLLLVSVLGGLAFTAAEPFEQLITDAQPELAVIGVHLAISGALLALARLPGPRRVRRPRTTKEVTP